MKISLVCMMMFIHALCASGCIPYRYTDRPGVTGDVVDAASGSRLSGVEVSLYLGKPLIDPYTGHWVANEFASNAADSTITNGAAPFTLAPEQHWGLYLLPQDNYSEPWRVWVRREGYEPLHIDFTHSLAGPGTKNVGRISLQPRLPINVDADGKSSSTLTSACRPETLFNAPDFGILYEVAEDVGRRSFIWGIPDKTGGCGPLMVRHH